MPPVRRQLAPSEAEDLLANLMRAGVSPPLIEDVSFPPRVEWQPRGVEGATFRRVSFDGPVIAGPLFRRGSLCGCVFHQVDFGGLRVRKVDFLDCRFEQCSLGHRHLGIVEDSTFVDCSIIGGRLDHVTFLRSIFRATVIDGVKAATLRWDGCTLEDMKVAGVFDGATFVRSTLRRADFSAAELRDSAILDGIGADVQLPDRPSNFAVPPSVLARAESDLRERLDAQALDTYKRLAKAYAQLGPSVIISEELFAELESRERQLVLGTLYELRKG